MKKIIGHEFAVVEELIASRVFSRLEYILPQRLPHLMCICDRTSFLSSRGNLRNILVPSSRKVAVEHEQCKGILTLFEKAKRVFDEMPREGILPSVATYNAMIQVLCKKDNVDNAILVFEEMLRKGYVPNSITYNLVIRGLCHAGHMDRAVQFMSRMEEDGREPNVQMYNIIIRYFCDAGEIENGMHPFEKMGSGVCLPNLDKYNIFVSSMFVRKKSDDLVLAGKLLIEMVDRGFVPRKLTFNRVLDGLLLIGNQGFAKEILECKANPVIFLVVSSYSLSSLLIHTEPANKIHPLFSARVSAFQILHNISASSKPPGDRFCHCKLLQM